MNESLHGEKLADSRDSPEASKKKRRNVDFEDARASPTHYTPAVTTYMEMKMVDDGPIAMQPKARVPAVKPNAAYLQKLQAQNAARKINNRLARQH